MLKYIKMFSKSCHTLAGTHRRIKRYAKSPDSFPVEQRFADVRELLLKVNEQSLRGYYIVNGLENVPQGQVIFTPNHTSNADPIAMIITSDRPIALVAKKEVAHMPYVGSINKAMSGTFIDRDDLREEIKSFKQIDETLKKYPTLSYVIFPEGTRSKGPRFNLGDFHSGSFKIAVRNKLPIVPVCIYLTDRIVNQNYHYTQYPIQVTYLKPLTYDDYKDMTMNEIASYVKDAVEKELVVQKEKDREYVKSLNGLTDKQVDKVLIAKPSKDNGNEAKKLAKRKAKKEKARLLALKKKEREEKEAERKRQLAEKRKQKMLDKVARLEKKKEDALLGKKNKEDLKFEKEKARQEKLALQREEKERLAREEAERKDAERRARNEAELQKEQADEEEQKRILKERLQALAELNVTSDELDKLLKLINDAKDKVEKVKNITHELTLEHGGDLSSKEVKELENQKRQAQKEANAARNEAVKTLNDITKKYQQNIQNGKDVDAPIENETVADDNNTSVEADNDNHEVDYKPLPDDYKAVDDNQLENNTEETEVDNTEVDVDVDKEARKERIRLEKLQKKQAKEEAKKQAKEEKEKARQEKLEAKEKARQEKIERAQAKAEEKERQRQEKLAEKESHKQSQEEYKDDSSDDENSNND